MTINIALSTSEGLILACDSISSTTGYFVPAFGDHVQSIDGTTYTATYKISDVVTQVTDSWGGVTKMFLLHAGDAPVAAITSGLAKLNDRTMSSCAHEFHRRQADDQYPLKSVGDVAAAFLSFMREKYDRHYQGTDVPEDFRDGPLFLIGGYGTEDFLPSIHRIDVKRNRAIQQFGPGQSGVAWEGQSDAVERLIRGYDVAVRIAIEKAVTEGIRQSREAASRATEQILQKLVDKVGAEKIGDMTVDVPESAPIDLPWDDFGARLSFNNLPAQDAIDFAAYLVNIQSGRAKFGVGVPTVGGRTHIGLITRQDGFRMIDEAPLTHRNTGFL
jgi:hypothetical protein